MKTSEWHLNCRLEQQLNKLFRTAKMVRKPRYAICQPRCTMSAMMLHIGPTNAEFASVSRYANSSGTNTCSGSAAYFTENSQQLARKVWKPEKMRTFITQYELQTPPGQWNFQLMIASFLSTDSPHSLSISKDPPLH